MASAAVLSCLGVSGWGPLLDHGVGFNFDCWHHYLYTGDAAGVYVPEADELRPATPPPDFDLDLALTSLARMRAAELP